MSGTNVYQAGVAEMRRQLLAWFGNGETEESAQRICEAYCAINNFTVVGVRGDQIQFVDAPPNPAVDVVLLTTVDAAAEDEPEATAAGWLPKPRRCRGRCRL